MEDRPPRKLAAILYADVAGYSRLTGEDEEGTHRRLSEYLDLISDAIEEHQGRVVHYAGDAVLADFGTVTEALSCATSIQRELESRNRDLPEERKVQFRIGVNLGEVIVDRDDIYGDGVNVAARLESLAEPGSICISESVRTAVGKKLDLDYEFMGEQNVKNIEEPVRAYRVVVEKEKEPKVVSPETPSLELPDKPSIAVLPFTNMSGDPEQEYFSDGITEDIITELSRFRELLVIARNSAFSYKGRAVKVQEIGRDLGVSYVLEGSVRRSGQRVRITAQLVEAASGTHIWAERFDRKLQDIFDLQDEITETIVKQLPVRLQGALVERGRGKPSSNLTAYDHYLQGRWLLEQSFWQSAEGLEQLGKAVGIDPHCAHAHAYIALVHAYSVFTFSPLGADPIATALKSIEQALRDGEGDHLIHTLAGEVFMICGEFDRAMNQSNKAFSLNPNDILTLRLRGDIIAYCGDATSAIDLFAKVQLHDPIAPDVYFEVLAESYYMAGDYEKALAIYQSWDNPPVHSHTHVAACYAQLGQMNEARTAVRTFKQKCPEGADFNYYATAHARICKRPQDAEHWLDGYRKAGLMT